MKVAMSLTMGVDSFTLLDLLRRAAAHKSLKLHEGASKAYSEPIKAYTLDDRLLTMLAEREIKQQDRPDCNHEIFTLVDENPQEKVPGWASSNYWNFKLLEGGKRKFDLQVMLSVRFGLNLEKRGIVLVPQAHGSFLSPSDSFPNLRMFKALVESDEDAPAVAKELAASDGSIVVTWTDLGLGGIRKLSHLFAEFSARNETVRQLGKNREVFDPDPNPQYQQPGDELFIAEPAQPKVIQAWRTQLNEYRTHLVV
ncbi:MAG TPA: hypothetical protein VMW21_02065 [Patescibacteria group bacterium]|nr:hypothetical protein [Patescibacteria group bacterium]